MSVLGRDSNDTLLNITSSITDQNETVFSLGVVDCVIVLVYLIGSVSLGLYLGWKHKTAEDYFLAGRSMKWPFVGLSLFATNVSSSSLVGMAGTAYKSGISVYNYVWSSGVILILYSTFFIPTILRLEIHTLPEMLELRYNAAARYYFSILSIILNIVADTGAGLYGGALVLKMIFPQLEIWHTVAILAAIAGVYTICGGLVAVMYTDALQAVTLMVGSILIAIFAFIEVGGWSSLKAQVPPQHLSLIRPIDDDAVPWTGLLFGIPIIGFYYWCTNQSIVQRMLSSKDSNHGRWGALFGGLCNLPLLFFMVLPGTMASTMFQDLPKPDLVYPKLMFTLLPVGVLGVVLSGFVAALLSDIDSNMNSASTLITMDFAKKLKPDLTTNQLMKLGKLVTFFIMILSASWAPFIANFSSLFQYFQKLMSYVIPPVVALYIVGFFWKGANARGAIVTLILGNTFGVLFFVLNEVLDVVSVHFLHVAPILFSLSSLILIGVSLFGGGHCSEDQLKVTWSFEEFTDDLFALKERPFWQNYHLHSFLLLIVTAVIVGCFW